MQSAGGYSKNLRLTVLMSLSIKNNTKFSHFIPAQFLTSDKQNRSNQQPFSKLLNF